MKINYSKFLIIAVGTIILTTEILNAQQPALRLRDDFRIQIGWEDEYENSTYDPITGATTYLNEAHILTFGRSLSTWNNIINTPTDPQNNGQWGIEAWNGGFNICKPWPNPWYGNYKLYIDSNDCVGIGTGYPFKLPLGNGQFINFKLDVQGYVASDWWYWYSDRRYKKNIQSLESDISRLLKLNGVRYNNSSEILKNKLEKMKQFEPKNEEEKYRHLMEIGTIERQLYDKEKDTLTHFGFIAQELRELYPELVVENAEGYLAVNYTGMIPVLVEAIKEQQNEIKSLRAEVNNLKDKGFEKTNTSQVISTAKLYQNNPNPFSENTEIKFYVPDNSSSAMICIYDLTGSQIMKFDLRNRGNSSLTVRGRELKAGMYIYSLIVDGKEIDTKRMILTE